MTDSPRLIEKAFCLKQASIDSVHEKNVRHGHISTLHIWPARRPLAACRAALIATLLPDPGTPEQRRKILERLAGKVVRKVEQKKMPGGRVVEQVKEETEGGILHWGRESGPDLDWFREQILKVYGRAPKVLDPFAGGGAIPLEAMRLGCEVTAIDINPVAWFILKCTLEYPQRLAGKGQPLPQFILEDEEFMEEFFKATGDSTPRPRQSRRQPDLRLELPGMGAAVQTPEADLSWQVRAWGRWVLREARKDLARFYPTYADFEPLHPGRPFNRREPRLVPLQEDGSIDAALLNDEFTKEYLADKENPRWVPKPTVAYLWARTVKCKDCRATVPLLKTRWLCKKEKKRVLLTMEPNPDKTGVVFGVETDVPERGGNPAQRREHDKSIGAGTMSRSGVKCPCCGTIMTMEDIKAEGQGGRLGAIMTAVVVEGPKGKEYRLPYPDENDPDNASKQAQSVFDGLPLGIPEEPFPGSGRHRAVGSQLPGYGFSTWRDLFIPRQLLALGIFEKHTIAASRIMKALGLRDEWMEALPSYLAAIMDRLANQSTQISRWNLGGENIEGTFARFAFAMLWDFAEVNPIGDTSGGYSGAIDWVSLTVTHLTIAEHGSPEATCLCQSALATSLQGYDIVLTDPPYYDAIPYSDLMDFFYVWLRRTLGGLAPSFDRAFRESLTPKWSQASADGELVDDPSRNGGSKSSSKMAYENGMFRAFQVCEQALNSEGRLVIVFAHKHPDAWETLVSAIIRAGFTVNGSWPIRTERAARANALNAAALSSSVWLVCKKRPDTARPGWDNAVLEEMQSNIHSRLREFWDAGVRGPDFVWAATGPALEAYSKHPVVRKANEPGQLMEIPEFLRAVRRIVVDFVVGRVLSKEGVETVSGLDDITTYYLLHRHDFGMADAAAGACILYAVSCGLSDRDLTDQYDILQKSGGQEVDEGDDEEDGVEETGEESGSSGSGTTVRLKPWDKRKGKTLGLDLEGRPSPLIDQVHHLMHLWKAGDVVKVDEYLDGRGLRRHQLFHQLLQALIELAGPGTEERSMLESISNHVASRRRMPQVEQKELASDPETD